MADVMEYAEKWRAALEPNDPYEAWIMTLHSPTTRTLRISIGSGHGRKHECYGKGLGCIPSK